MSANKKIARKYQESKDSKRYSGKRPVKSRKSYPNKKQSDKNNKRETDLSAESVEKNDPAWYGQGPLRDGVASLFFSNPSGLPFRELPAGVESDMGLSATQYDYGTAGILTLHICPTFGPNAGLQSPINIAAQAMYGFIRSANSGSRNYDPNDLMTYVLAIAEAFSLINHLERIYGIARYYVAQNKYMPEHLLAEMDVNFSDVQGKFLEFATGINLLISKMGAFAVPANMSYFKRKVFLYSNIYIDSDNPKDQIYMMVPDGFYAYTVDNNYPEAYLKYSQWPTNATVSDMLTYANNLINELWTAEDSAIICGDILKAYKDNIIQLQLMPLEWSMGPVVMDDNLRFQIRNATIINEYPGPDIHQDSTKQYLDWNCYLEAPGTTGFDGNYAANNIYLLSGPTIITSNNVNPTPDEIMESTRLTACTANPDIGSNGVIADLICGTEIVTHVTTKVLKRNRSTKAISATPFSFYSAHRSYSSSNLINLAQFRWHPSIYQWTAQQGSGATQGINTSTGVFVGIFNELDSITTIDESRLYNMHEVALMEEIAAPAIALLK